MGQISSKLREAVNGHTHYCPGCQEPHLIPDSWSFDGNLDQPTFTPSVRITGVQRLLVNGKWEGGFVKDSQGNPVPFCCHYNLTIGVIHFHGDSTHQLSGVSMPLPELPDWLTD